MYLISGQSHLCLQPAVALVAAHAKLRLYAVQGVVGKDAFMPQISVGKGAKGLLRAAVCCDISITGGPAAADVQVRSGGNVGQTMNRACRAQRGKGAAVGAMDASLFHRISPPVLTNRPKNLFALITVISNEKIKKIRPLFQILQFVHIFAALRQHRTESATDRFAYIQHRPAVQRDRRIEQHRQKVLFEIFHVCVQIA